MVDFHDPLVIQGDAFALVKLWDVVNGIFIWEFIVTLNYEWSVIRRRRPYRWSIWIYSLTRMCALIALWVVFELIFAYMAFAAASLLIVLRIIAIWDRNRIVVAIAMSAWFTDVGFLIYGITQLRATWVSTQSACVVPNTENSKITVIATLVSDVVLLLTMLAGLLRLRQYSSNMSGLCQHLWRQGLIWLLLVTVAEVTPTVFISLNLNDPFNLMFQTPALIITSIAATRLHRSLGGYSCSSGPSYDTSYTQSGRTASSEPKWNSTAPIPLEIAVRRSFKEYPAQAGQCGPVISTKGRSQDKTLVLSVGNDLENGIERG